MDIEPENRLEEKFRRDDNEDTQELDLPTETKRSPRFLKDLESSMAPINELN